MMQGMAMNFVFLTLIVAWGHGSSEFKRNLDGILFWGCASARNLGGNLL